MSGVRLEAYVHIITGAVGAVKNLTTCVNDAGMAVESVVLEPIASAESVLNSEEKLIGVALADIGGGTTDTVVYKDGALRHTEVLSIGGDNLTHDIAQLLKMIQLFIWRQVEIALQFIFKMDQGIWTLEL